MTTAKTLNRIFTVMIIIGIAMCLSVLGVLAWWASDRDAPFVLLDYHVDAVKAGGNTVVIADVRRDMSRSCSVSFSRTFFDSKGTRFELTEGSQMMNRAALELYNRRSPNILAFNVAVPKAAAPGWGTVMTPLDYECNPIHQWRPISMVLTQDVEVLP